MLYMKLVLHNQINHPVYLEIPIPVEVMRAIRTSKITGVEYLFFERGSDSDKLIKPADIARTEINRFDVIK